MRFVLAPGRLISLPRLGSLSALLRPFSLREKESCAFRRAELAPLPLPSPSPSGRRCRRRMREGCFGSPKRPSCKNSPSSGAARHLLPEGEGKLHLSQSLLRCLVFPSPSGRRCRRRMREGCFGSPKRPSCKNSPSSGAARHLLPEGEGNSREAAGLRRDNRDESRRFLRTGCARPPAPDQPAPSGA